MNFNLINKIIKNCCRIATPIFMVILMFFTTSCSVFKKNTDQNIEKNPTTKKKRVNPNALERARNYEGDGILFGKKSDNKFGGQNVLWVATLETIDFMPLVSASYDGGIIVTDWYSPKNSDESVKFQIEFLSSEIKSSSVNIKSFKKICETNNGCKITENSRNFNQKIKDQIFAKVRDLELKKVSK